MIIGLLLFTSDVYGEGEKKATGLGLKFQSPVIKAAIVNKRKLKLVVKQLLSMTLSEVKSMKGITFTVAAIKEAFGPLAKNYFPDVWETYSSPEKSK